MWEKLAWNLFFPASAVRRYTSFPLIFRKSIRAIFTKFGMQDYWVSVLLTAVVALLLTE